MELVIAGFLMLSVNGITTIEPFSYSFLTTDCSATHAEQSVNDLANSVEELSSQRIAVDGVSYTFECK